MKIRLETKVKKQRISEEFYNLESLKQKDIGSLYIVKIQNRFQELSGENNNENNNEENNEITTLWINYGWISKPAYMRQWAKQ